VSLPFLILHPDISPTAIHLYHRQNDRKIDSFHAEYDLLFLNDEKKLSNIGLEYRVRLKKYAEFSS
jgi:hypothetical protein